MIDGKCPRCEAEDVYVTTAHSHRNALMLSAFSSVSLSEYICCACGLVQTFLRDMEAVAKVRKKATKVEPGA
jgi:hypothetical protein